MNEASVSQHLEMSTLVEERRSSQIVVWSETAFALDSCHFIELVAEAFTFHG